jgi:cytochrome c oxidase subunit I
VTVGRSTGPADKPLPTIVEDDRRLRPDAVISECRDLDNTWRNPRGFFGWFTNVDHKSIGRRFLVTAFVFFALGGIEAALMRLQLSRPDNHILDPDLYNQIFTTHGTTMMFLFAVPVMLAVGIYFVPLMIGARSIAFPRLVAFGYWMFLFGGMFLYVMFFANVGPDVGWFSYPPLAGPEYGIGKRPDVWAQLITFSELSALAIAIALIATIFKLRAPGMSLNRIPVFVWAILVMAFMIVFAMPSVMIASTCLILDRLVGTHFFNQAEGGDAILWQHLFWFFGHPEVYIIFLPAQGMMSMLIATFSRRPVFGQQALVLSLVSTAFIGFGVWVHHMFATGLPQFGASFFTAASIMIVVPTGLQFFCWIATLWTGRLSFETPMLYALGFFGVFLIGGLTGVMLAAVPLDLQVHDTFFVVAHLHYVLIGGSVFPLLGSIHYWFPKLTGRMMSERLGKIGFWGVFAGFNLTFFPQHMLGLMGMPRRVYTYPAEMGWGTLNLVSSAGAGILAMSLLVYLVNVIVSARRGALAADNPWNSASLEWATSSPPPPYNFAPLPTVSGQNPLWEQVPSPTAIVGVASDRREVLITRVMDAEPDHRYEMPGPSIWPFVTALMTSGLFINSIFTPWAVVWWAFPVTVAMLAWFWPRAGKTPREIQNAVARGEIRPQEAM